MLRLNRQQDNVAQPLVTVTHAVSQVRFYQLHARETAFAYTRLY